MKPFDIATDVTLECPSCRSYKTVPRSPELPAEVRLIEIICPDCDDGDFHSECWFSAPGVEVSQDKREREERGIKAATEQLCELTKRWTIHEDICGFVIDAKYAAEKPATHLQPGKRCRLPSGRQWSTTTYRSMARRQGSSC